MKISIIIKTVLLVLSSSLFGETITQAEFLQQIRDNHPLFEKEKLAVEIETSDRDAYLGAQDWVVNSGPYFARQNVIPQSAFAPEKVDVVSFGAGMGRTFWKTGGRLTVDWTTDYNNQHGLEDMVIPFSSFSNQIPDMIIEAGEPRYYQSNIMVSYLHPLMQNAGGNLDRLGYDIEDYDRKVAEVQGLENQEELLLSMGLKYLEWVYLFEQKMIASDRLKLAQQQLEQIERKRASNLVDQVDVLRAQDAVRIAEQGIVLINAQFKSKQVEMSVLAGSNTILEQNPLFDLYKQETLLELETALTNLIDRSRLLRIVEIRSDQLKRHHQGLEELTKPKLFLNTSLALRKGGVEFGDALGADKSDLGVALQFSYPLGNKEAMKKVERNNLQQLQLQAAREEVRLQLEAALKSLYIQIEEYDKALHLNQKQIESARDKTREELQRYNQGRGDLAFVIQSQDNEQMAKLTYAQNALTYHSLKLNLKALLDDLNPVVTGSD